MRVLFSYSLSGLTCRLTVLMVLLSNSLILYAQNENALRDDEMEQLEWMAERDDELSIEDEAMLLYPGVNRIAINDVTEEALLSTGIMTLQQAKALLNHIHYYGKIISKYELQAVEGWDMDLIRKIIPMVSFQPVQGQEGWKEKWLKGSNMLLVKYGNTLERKAGVLPDSSGKDKAFNGDQSKLLIRYRYNFRNRIQYGFLMEKDAGEKVLPGGLNLFDHQSAYVSIADPFKFCNRLIFGDYTVNLGQGLIQWQGFGFGVGSGAMNIKKNGTVIKPYTSSGEINFYRGLATAFNTKRTKHVFFFSTRNIDASMDEDTIRSLPASGLHRTASELEQRKSAHLIVMGMHHEFSIGKLELGANAVDYRFSEPYVKKPEPYNRFALNDDNWRNYSINYSITRHNLHLFGEMAMDKRFAFAQLHGLVASLHKHLDASVLFRKISPRFQSLYARSFTQNTSVNNETGIYVSIAARWKKITMEGYSDLFYFPWLKYRVDQPSHGSAFALLLQWMPRKNLKASLRIRREYRQVNSNNNLSNTHGLMDIENYSARAGMEIKNDPWLFRFRMEQRWYKDKNVLSNGFLCFAEAHFNAGIKQPFKGNFRIQYFEVDDFNARIYAFENDVQYGFSVPFFSETGYRYYFALRYAPGHELLRKFIKDRQLQLSCKWSQSFFPFEMVTGSGPDLVQSNRRSDIQLQLLIQ